mgnify:CR=1 FL=1
MADQKRLADTLEHYDLPKNPLGEIFKAQKRFGSKFCDFDSIGLDKKNSFRHATLPMCESDVTEWKNVFLDCIEDEISEIRGWIPWKHWKKYEGFEVDVVELRFELIDILHFIISEFLIFKWDEKEVFNFFDVNVEVDKADSLDALLYKVKGQQMARMLCDPSLHRPTQVKETIKGLRNLIKLVGKGYEDPTNGKTFKDIMYVLFDLFVLWGMTGSDVYDYYMSKNKENFNRQERRY